MSFEITQPIYGDINGAAPYSVPNITFVTVPYNGVPTLRGGMLWDAVTFEYIVPVDGVYQIQGWMTLDKSALLPGDVPGQSCVEHLMAVFLNGVVTCYMGNHMVTVDPVKITGTASWLHGAIFLPLTAGTRVKLAHWHHGNFVWPALVSARTHWFQIIYQSQL